MLCTHAVNHGHESTGISGLSRGKWGKKGAEGGDGGEGCRGDRVISALWLHAFPKGTAAWISLCDGQK